MIIFMHGNADIDENKIGDNNSEYIVINVDGDKSE